MKKIILILSIFLVSNLVEAKIISLTNCSEGDSKKEKIGMNENYQKNEYIIDTDKKIVFHNTIMTDKYVKEFSELMTKNMGKPWYQEKIRSYEHKILFNDNKFVKTFRKPSNNYEQSLEINLDDRFITSLSESTLSDGRVFNIKHYIYCEGTGANNFLKKILEK